MEAYISKFATQEHLNNKIFQNAIKFTCKNAVDELQDALLSYLKRFPQQIVLISEDNFILLMSSTRETLHPLVLFLASRHNGINYHLEMNTLCMEKWAYLMSAFHQGKSQIMADRVFIKHAKKKINCYEIFTECPQWFIDNVDFFISVAYDKKECEKWFTKLKADWSKFVIKKASVSFLSLITSTCNKERELTQFLVTTFFSLPIENSDATWLYCYVVHNMKSLGTDCPIEISDWEAIIIKSITALMEIIPEYVFVNVLRKIIKKIDVDKSVVTKFFELLVGHSRFPSIMLSREENQPQKEEILRTIELLVKKEPSIMALSHVPLYLCSYNASLSTIDQLLLKILFHYEENAIPMSNYRPYLWGSFAVSHYQATNHLMSKTLSSFPSTTEVLSYIPSKRLKKTISCFPIDRKLHVKDQKIATYFDSSTDACQSFDPAFFLPMISSLLATEAPLSIEKFNTSGCLSMVLTCLGSLDGPMRSAAYHILTLLRSHLFCRRAENMLWDYFISWVARGIQDLHLKPPPQLSMIQACFLSKIVSGIANHENIIESVCAKLLLARPAARLNHIPELKSFLVSPHETLKSRDKTLLMRWFLVIVRDGLRTKNDWQVLKKMDILNIIIVAFSNGNQRERLLILEIMELIFRIEPATNGGCGHWALSFMTVIFKETRKMHASEVVIVLRCLQTLINCSFISTPMMDFLLYLFERYGKDPDLCREAFHTFYLVIFKNQDSYKDIRQNDLFRLLSYGVSSNVLSDDEITLCRSVLDYGVEGFLIENENVFLYLPALVKIFKAKSFKPKLRKRKNLNLR